MRLRNFKIKYNPDNPFPEQSYYFLSKKAFAARNTTVQPPAGGICFVKSNITP